MGGMGMMGGMGKMRTDKKIIQIIPAAGWYAVYADSGTETRCPLACWGLYDEWNEVVGMDTDSSADGPQDCSLMSNFLRYEHESQIPIEQKVAARPRGQKYGEEWNNE
jgi:DNA gyrase inhibitor GyrI